MSAVRPVVALALLALLLAGGLAAGGRAVRRAPAKPAMAAPYPDQFPAGPGDEIAGRACAICHSPQLVAQQAKDSLGWEKTLAQMEKWGAPVAPGEHDSLRTYLLAHFGAKPAGK